MPATNIKCCRSTVINENVVFTIGFLQPCESGGMSFDENNIFFEEGIYKTGYVNLPMEDLNLSIVKSFKCRNPFLKIIRNLHSVHN